jgi:hypothetical protein
MENKDLIRLINILESNMDWDHFHPSEFERKEYIELHSKLHSAKTAVEQVRDRADDDFVKLYDQEEQPEHRTDGIDKDWIFEIINKTNQFAKQLIEDHFKRHTEEYASQNKAMPTDEEIEKFYDDAHFEHRSWFDRETAEYTIKWFKSQLSQKVDSWLREERERTIIECTNELLKHLFPMIHANGYPSEAVPKATILELPALLRVKSQLSQKADSGLREELIKSQVWCEDAGQMKVDYEYCKQVVDEYLESLKGE